MTMHGVQKTLFSAVLLIGTIGSVSAVELVDPATETIVFRHADVLGSPVATTDDQGRVLWYENTTAFGNSLGRRAAGGRGFGDNAVLHPDVQVGYTGHSNDTASGLTYMKARYYDPAISRFYSNDPVGFNTGNLSMFNRYAYANNNPYLYNDPDGEVPLLALLATPPGQAAVVTGLNAAGAVATAVSGFFAIRIAGQLQGKIAGELVMNNEDSDSESEPLIDQKKSEKRSRRPSVAVQGEADILATDEDGDLVCSYCGQPLTTESGHSNSREYDHEVPYVDGGENTIENINSTCRTCNRSKGSKDLDDWMDSQ